MDNSRLLGDIANTPLFVLAVTDTVGQTLQLAQANGIHHFPVCDGKRVVGFTCVCDMIGATEDTSVELVMTVDVTTLPESATVREAAQVMQDTGRGSVLVTNEDGVCGIVTRADVVAWDRDADELLTTRCDCCGLRKHLRKLDGRTLCAFCQDSTTEQDWMTHGHSESP